VSIISIQANSALSPPVSNDTQQRPQDGWTWFVSFRSDAMRCEARWAVHLFQPIHPSLRLPSSEPNIWPTHL